jgi:SAM-dependent methyltransferase
MIRWLDDRAAYDAAIGELGRERATIEPWLKTLARSPGYCCACNKVVDFRVGPEKKNDWLSLRETFVCLGCLLNGRSRMMLLLLRREIADGRPRTLLLEQMTALFTRVHEEFPFVAGCEFLGPDIEPGATRAFQGRQVRHEDMLRLSCADGSLDLIVHGDVLEHVPDFRLALRECARVLVPGGRMLFTAPFFDLAQHLVRAEVIDGELVHHLKPGYHENPISREGSLVFTHFGWPLLDDVKQAGFRDVAIGLCYDPFQGIVSNNNPYPDGHLWPIAFRATR